MTIELKLSTGKFVVWEGNDAEDAARRYVDTFRDATVIGWRHYPRKGMSIWGGRPIIEPGTPG